MFLIKANEFSVTKVWGRGEGGNRISARKEIKEILIHQLKFYSNPMHLSKVPFGDWDRL